MSDSGTSPAQDAAQWFRQELERRLRFARPFVPILYRRVFGVVENAYRQFLNTDEPPFSLGLRKLRVTCERVAQETSHIPREGPVVIVANHPHAGLEGLLLGEILSGIRTDFKFLATSSASIIPCFSEHVIPVARKSGGIAYHKAVHWLKKGGLVVVFPAGASAKRVLPTFELVEQPWSTIAVTLARWSKASVVPVYFHGSRHWTYYAAGLLYSDLRYLALIWQEWRSKPRTIRVSIGAAIQIGPRLELESPDEVTAFLRAETLALSELRRDA